MDSGRWQCGLADSEFSSNLESKSLKRLDCKGTGFSHWRKLFKGGHLKLIYSSSKEEEEEGLI
jgi:hypothetical protein